MDSANQIKTLVEQVEKEPKYKISKQKAKSFLSEIKRITKANKTNMPPYSCDNSDLYQHTVSRTR